MLGYPTTPKCRHSTGHVWFTIDLIWACRVSLLSFSTYQPCTNHYQPPLTIVNHGSNTIGSANQLRTTLAIFNCQSLQPSLNYDSPKCVSIINHHRSQPLLSPSFPTDPMVCHASKASSWLRSGICQLTEQRPWRRQCLGRHGG